MIALPQVSESRFGSFEVLYSISFASWSSTWNAKSGVEVHHHFYGDFAQLVCRALMRSRETRLERNREEEHREERNGANVNREKVESEEEKN